MEYIYCKNGEEFEYAKSVLLRAGYKGDFFCYWSNRWSNWFLRATSLKDVAQKRGLTLYVSDDEMKISPYVEVGFRPKGYKPSRLMMDTDVWGDFYTTYKLYNIRAYKDLNTKLNTELKSNLKSDLEPLDDTEELKADREKLRKFAKDTKGKAKITLAPMQILKDVAEVREYGVKKYGSVDSWKEVPIEDYRDALFRHLLEYIKDPNSVDKESGIKHYKHIACNLAFICEMESKDDDPTSI